MSIAGIHRSAVPAAALALALLVPGCFPASEAPEEPSAALDKARESVRLPDQEELSEAASLVTEEAGTRLRNLGWAPIRTEIDLSDKMTLPVPAEQETTPTAAPVPVPVSATTPQVPENDDVTPSEPAPDNPATPETETPVSSSPPVAAADERAGEDLTSLAVVFPESLSLCPMMSVSNAPQAEGLAVAGYAPVIELETGPVIAVAPVDSGCLSSGFGPRGGTVHKGIDLHNARPTAVFAAADGVVRVQRYRDDYGNMIVIDHGDGWYTRYAHLSAFESGISVGSTVRAGETIGQMGNTASYPIPIHLHYEVLTGDWGEQAGSFALDPVDILSYLPAN